MKNIFVCSPLRGDIIGNIEKAKGYCRSIALAGEIPIAPHVFFTTFLDDTKDAERQIGIKMGMWLLELCDELWVFGEPSQGMQDEINIARECGMIIRDGNEALWNIKTF